MDFRPGCLKRRDLRDKCFDLVTEDRITFWEATVIRAKRMGFTLMGLLKIGLWRSRNQA